MSSIEAANLFNVNGLVAVVTGGGSGIGFMMAKALALNGADRVYIIGRRKENLETAAKESPYQNIIPIQGDVTSKESLSSIVARIQQEIGHINVLIANSGIGGPQEGSSATRPDLSLEEFQSKLWSTSFEDYTQTFAVNASSVFFSIVAFLGLLHAGNEKGNVVQKSQVIVTSSIGGYNRNVPGGYAYGQSKAAATQLVKQMATNLVPYEIRANALAPGLYPSDMSAGITGGATTFPHDKIPAGRAGSEDDMAGCILYLTSRAGAYCNGNVIVTDGGRLSVMSSTY